MGTCAAPWWTTGSRSRSVWVWVCAALTHFPSLLSKHTLGESSSSSSLVPETATRRRAAPRFKGREIPGGFPLKIYSPHHSDNDPRLPLPPLFHFKSNLPPADKLNSCLSPRSHVHQQESRRKPAFYCRPPPLLPIHMGCHANGMQIPGPCVCMYSLSLAHWHACAGPTQLHLHNSLQAPIAANKGK